MLEHTRTHLRTSVVRRSAAGLEHGAPGLEGGHAEVGHLDVVLVVEQEVLGLQVAVADRVAVGGNSIGLKIVQKLAQKKWPKSLIEK